MRAALEGVPVTRRELIEPLLASETWRSLNEKFDVVLRPFASDDPTGTSDLAAPLEAWIDRLHWSSTTVNYSINTDS